MTTLIFSIFFTLGFIFSSGLLYELILLDYRSKKMGISEKARHRIMIWAFLTGCCWTIVYLTH